MMRKLNEEGKDIKDKMLSLIMKDLDELKHDMCILDKIRMYHKIEGQIELLEKMQMLKFEETTTVYDTLYTYRI